MPPNLPKRSAYAIKGFDLTHHYGVPTYLNGVQFAARECYSYYPATDFHQPSALLIHTIILLLSVIAFRLIIVISIPPKPEIVNNSFKLYHKGLSIKEPHLSLLFVFPVILRNAGQDR